MKTAVTVMMLTASLPGVTVPAAVPPGMVDAPAPTAWPAGGLGPHPPPPPIADWCTPDNPDPTCHPPRHHINPFLC
jgi:hypothetical protein